MEEEAEWIEATAVEDATGVAVDPDPVPVAEPRLAAVAEAPPLPVAQAPWAPRPLSLGTVKAAATFAACVLALIGMCVGEARARGERIARAPVVVPSVVEAARPTSLVSPAAAPPPTAPPCFGCLPLGQLGAPSPRKVGGGGRAATALVNTVGLATVTGSLPAEVVSRIVRQNHGRFRLCYEAGLRARPDLMGRVSVKFVIGRDGVVSSAAASSESTLPDSSVIACVTRALGAMTFPAPEGVVTVVYRLALTVE